MVLDGVSCDLICSDTIAGGQPCLSLEVHDLEAAKRSLSSLMNDMICAIGEEEGIVSGACYAHARVSTAGRSDEEFDAWPI